MQYSEPNSPTRRQINGNDRYRHRRLHFRNMHRRRRWTVVEWV